MTGLVDGSTPGPYGRHVQPRPETTVTPLQGADAAPLRLADSHRGLGELQDRDATQAEADMKACWPRLAGCL